MTQRDRGVDWDLLADHLGGALTGTPEGERVTALVATDLSWANAAAELSGALAAVTADLHALPVEPMPDDVVERLTTALSGAAETAAGAGAEQPRGATEISAGSGAGSRRAALPPSGERADADEVGGAPARSGQEGTDVARVRPYRPPAQGRSPEDTRPGSAGGPRRPPRHPASRRRRRLARWGAGLLVAAGIAAFASLGLTTWELGPGQIVAGDDDGEAAGGSADYAVEPEAADAEQPNAGPARGGTPTDPEVPAVIAVTGTDYDPRTFASAEAEPEEAAGAPSLGDAEAEPNRVEPPPSVAIGTDDVPAGVPPELDRLWADPQARTQCLAAIAATLEPAPVIIDTVDFARFQGEDALVMWATVDDGTRWAIAVGPDCGSSGVGADERYRTQVS